MPAIATAYSYLLLLHRTRPVHGFQFVTRSSTQYRILGPILPLSSKGFHCRCYVIYYAFLFKRTVKSVLCRWMSSNQLTQCKQ